MKTCVFFKSGIGNFIMSTPALQALADMDERGKTDICFDYHWAYDPRIPSIINMIEHTPFIDKLVKHPGECRISDYDIWFITCQSEISNTSSEIKSRLAPGFRLMQMHDYKDNNDHEIDINLENVYRLGYACETKNTYVPVGEGPILEGQRPYIGLCNGAFNAPMWKKKHWPHFEKLAGYIKDFFGGTLYGVGSNGELDDIFLDVNYCGQLEMIETTKVISQFDLFITTDTGCMHAADALGVPLVALFGSTMISKNGPRGLKSYVITADLPCSPCYYSDRFFECEYAGCMAFIYPEFVMAKAREVLNRYYGI